MGIKELTDCRHSPDKQKYTNKIITCRISLLWQKHENETVLLLDINIQQLYGIY